LPGKECRWEKGKPKMLQKKSETFPGEENAAPSQNQKRNPQKKRGGVRGHFYQNSKGKVTMLKKKRKGPRKKSNWKTKGAKKTRSYDFPTY